MANLFKEASAIDEVFESLEKNISDVYAAEDTAKQNKVNKAINNIKIAAEQFDLAGDVKNAAKLNEFLNKFAQGDDDYRFEEEKSGVEERELFDNLADEPTNISEVIMQIDYLFNDIKQLPEEEKAKVKKLLNNIIKEAFMAGTKDTFKALKQAIKRFDTNESIDKTIELDIDEDHWED